MADAVISRRGGGKLKLEGIRIATPPARLEYFASDAFDPSGMVVYATISGAEMAITGYTFSPEILSPDTDAVTITYTLDGVTANAAQPVGVIAADATLANNSWETIARVAASGKAADVWNVGDIKVATINGTGYEFRIIGFDHDVLDTTDAKYNDASYNGGKKLAGITFMLASRFATQYSMGTSTPYGWGNSKIRSTILPTKIKALLQADVLDAMRTVKKTYASTFTAGKPSASASVADDLFLLSAKELLGGYENYDEGTQYGYFAAGNTCKFSYAYWTRSLHASYASSGYYIIITANGQASYRAGHEENYIYPAFCV